MREGCKALCGMLNTDKGKGLILFGISPNAEVVGLKETNLKKDRGTIGFVKTFLCSIKKTPF